MVDLLHFHSRIYFVFTEGDYKIVNFKRNKLERIDPYVFQFMLEGMFKGLTKRGRGAAALELYGSISTISIIVLL